MPESPLLTAREAIAYLRLDGKKPAEALRRYRNLGRLRGVRIGRSVKYLIADLDKFIQRQASGK